MKRPESLPWSIPWSESARRGSDELAFALCESPDEKVIAVVEEEEINPSRESFLKWWHYLIPVKPSTVGREFADEVKGVSVVIASRGADYGDEPEDFAVLFENAVEATDNWNGLVRRAMRRRRRSQGGT